MRCAVREGLADHIARLSQAEAFDVGPDPEEEIGKVTRESAQSEWIEGTSSRAGAPYEEIPETVGQATARAERGQPKKFFATPLGRNLDRFRRECGWSFDDMAAATELDKKLILGHANKGKNARLSTLATYARTFTEKLGRSITIAALED